MIHVYSGNGKGKTSSAMGAAIRAAGAGLKVLVIQFLKGRKSSELDILKNINNIRVFNYGRTDFVFDVTDEDISLAGKALDKLFSENEDFNPDVIILDEILDAIELKLIDISLVMSFLITNGKNKEILLTGHNADGRILELADLVTEMTSRKHYHDRGIGARKGIEY
ncbi:MAG: cob(I)yrinic acid a,c-diamide adenosyltransferase [Candidatus Coatesbacteria bacterium]|nr:cob(I)yrinic acid a,c-diamide adenosyltransferase [Candidatus Coatesbacteria bacterium]